MHNTKTPRGPLSNQIPGVRRVFVPKLTHTHYPPSSPHDYHSSPFLTSIPLMEAVEPTRRVILRQGGLQRQHQHQQSTWSSFAFAPSWIQSGIQTLKQSVFGPSNPSSQQQESLDSLLGKRSEPAGDRDPGPTPKRPRRQSPPVRVRSDSLEPQPTSIPHSVCPPLIFPLLIFFRCSHSHCRP